MSRDDPERKAIWLVYAGVPGAWLVFALMVLAISWGGAATRNRPFDFANTAVWNLGWLLWAAATFGVRALARRFPIDRSRLGARLVVHAGLGLVVTLAMLAVEFLLTAGLQALWPATIRASPLAALVVYKFHIYFLVYGMIVGVSGAFDTYARLQRSELAASQWEARLAQAQVQALKMQLHPHFLFNTHHSIVSLMLKNENTAAIKMLTRLSDLLRATLKKTDQQMTSLQEELEMVDLYLGIQRERYQDRLAVEIAIDAAAAGAEVPCLLLQPLVENALQHGIDACPAGGRLVIDARAADGRLSLSIRDDGPGLPPGFSLERRQGVGLRSTRTRLRHLYGAQARFEMVSRTEGGTEVRVELPLREFVPGEAAREEPSAVR